jgi:hypothetical protein
MTQRRRRESVHTIKRRLMRRLEAVSSYECERVLTAIREYVIARAFFNGSSFESLARSETLGNAEWTSERIQRAVRAQRRAGHAKG